MKEIIELVNGVTGLLVALASLLAAILLLWREIRHLLKRRKGPALAPSRNGPLAPIAISVLVVLALVILGLRFLHQSPTLEIVAPIATVEVRAQGSSVHFPVTGNSSGIASDNSLKIYPLVYWATDWHIQRPASVDPDGRWSLDKVWIGGPGSEVVADSVLRLTAVASKQRRAPDEKVAAPQDLAPVAQSQVLEVRVAKVQTPDH